MHAMQKHGHKPKNNGDTKEENLLMAPSVAIGLLNCRIHARDGKSYGSEHNFQVWCHERLQRMGHSAPSKEKEKRRRYLQ